MVLASSDHAVYLNFAFGATMNPLTTEWKIQGFIMKLYEPTVQSQSILLNYQTPMKRIRDLLSN